MISEHGWVQGTFFLMKSDIKNVKKCETFL